MDQSFDALLVVSFGGPESLDQVEPFLRRVTADRNVPERRVAEVARHYRELGGISPLNQANRDLVERLRAEAPARWVGDRVYFGNRNSSPFLEDAVATMEAAGVRRAAVFITSAFSSYSGCRQYREDLSDATQGRGIQLSVLPRFFDHAVLRDIWADRVVEALPGGKSVLVFVTHSLPVGVSDGRGPHGGYLPQHKYLAEAVRQCVARRVRSPIPWRLAFQSRSGPAREPWLEPDVKDAIVEVAGQGYDSCVVAPIGYCADNLEIRWDLDVAAAEVARDCGVAFHRLDPPQSDERFPRLIWDLLRRYPHGWQCDRECCPNPRGPRLAVADVDR